MIADLADDLRFGLGLGWGWFGMGLGLGEQQPVRFADLRRDGPGIETHEAN